MIHTALMFAAIFTLLILSARYLIQRKGSKAIDRDWPDGVRAPVRAAEDL